MSHFTCIIQFKAVFSTFKDVKVIQFSSMQDAFLGFNDKASLFFIIIIISSYNLFNIKGSIKKNHFCYNMLTVLIFYVQTTEQKFRNRVKRYVGIWCCVSNHTPGHIFYDMYWDEKPGWKPIPPQTPEDDHPPL
jgi:hypothetical protein